MRAPGLAPRLTVLLVSALAAATAVVAVTSRGDLRDARGEVDTAWEPLRAGLAARYEALGAAGDAAEPRLPADSQLLADLDAGINEWVAAGGAPGGAGGGARPSVRPRQVQAANALEGLAARLVALTQVTPRMQTSAEVTNAVAALAAEDPAEARVEYNRAVARYESVRGGFPRRLVAGALGFDALRTVEVTT